jgi:hypothetical protein
MSCVPFSCPRVVWLVQEGEEGNGLLAILLRSVEWIKEHGLARVGDWCELKIPDMGAIGRFQLMAVDSCPAIEVGPGCPCTGEFHHLRGEVWDLWIEGESQPIGVTPGHPAWSADRCDWVPASELRVLERVRVEGGTRLVLGMGYAGEEPVVNLEVAGDHCYRVGEQGLLVHNASASQSKNSCCKDEDGKYEPLGYENVQFNGRTRQRSKGVRAYITKKMIGKGSQFNRHGPDWWSELRDSVHPTGEWHRGHLLGNQLGGPGGSDWRNMVPLHARANDPAMENCESLIRKVVEDCGTCVHFLATPIYTGNTVVPDRIIITIRSDDGTFSKRYTIQNVPNAQSNPRCDSSNKPC